MCNIIFVHWHCICCHFHYEVIVKTKRMRMIAIADGECVAVIEKKSCISTLGFVCCTTFDTRSFLVP